MSSRIGTMQHPRTGQFMVPALLALLIVATFAAVVVSIDRDRVGEETATSTVQSSTIANTPTELRGGLPASSVGGTLANTPTEIRGGFAQAKVTFEAPSITGRRGVTPRVSAFDGPTLPHRPIDVNGTLCGQCA